jgi:hypothetical protein
MSNALRARVIKRTAPLVTDAGYAAACNWFGQDAISSLPQYQSGKHKGKPRGHLIYLDTIEAGYHPNAGVVPARTTVKAWIGARLTTPSYAATAGEWLNRCLPLCGEGTMLTAEFRSRVALQKKRDEIERDTYTAEELREIRKG